MTGDSTVDMGEWLSAIHEAVDHGSMPVNGFARPVWLREDEFKVGLAWAQSETGEAARAYAAERFGTSEGQFDDSTRELVAIGFFDEILGDEQGDHVERTLLFRIPGKVAV